jgi:hypothetical protein
LSNLGYKEETEKLFKQITQSITESKELKVKNFGKMEENLNILATNQEKFINN